MDKGRGNRRQEYCSVPSGLSSRAATTPTSGKASSWRESVATAPGWATVSGLSSSRWRPRAAAMPRLQARAKPTLPPASISRASGSASSAPEWRAVPELSTTITSSEIGSAEEGRLSRQARSSASLW